MNSQLHDQKLDILSRLIKEGHISLKEALLLLEEETEQIMAPQQVSPWPTWQSWPVTVGGSGTVPLGGGSVTLTPGSGLTLTSTSDNTIYKA